MKKLGLSILVLCAFLVVVSSALDDKASRDESSAKPTITNSNSGDDSDYSDSSSEDSKSSDSSSEDSKSSDSSSEDSKSSDSSSEDSKSSDSSSEDDPDLGVILTEKDLGCGTQDITFGHCMRYRHMYDSDNHSSEAEKMKKEYKYWMGMKPCLVKCVMKHGAHHGDKTKMPEKIRACQKECICTPLMKCNMKYNPSKGGGRCKKD
ncbi:hypothetical protein FJR45_10210 [Sulfurimonas sediminis]|uniref:Uncharacterized protein n=1 Tax=Sulfurimonas sediminis TaxID=2590020 RepID=A0A7M1B3K4_9BACT|nr:hypothetical protein [Sulfurimonas sediminis]QOP44294.1 hypothetical protein FJR45_10210 [Sulfurimonas sediminis]